MWRLGIGWPLADEMLCEALQSICFSREEIWSNICEKMTSIEFISVVIRFRVSKMLSKPLLISLLNFPPLSSK